MPFDRRHVVIQWGGSLTGGEEFSNRLRLGSPETGNSASVPTHDEMVEWLQTEIKDEVAAFHSSAASKISSTVKLLYVKANVVDVQGHYVEQNTLEYVYPTPVAGGSTGTFHPNQITLAISLTTQYQRGLGHRGRWYMPCPAIDVDRSDGMISAADATSVAGSAKSFLEALADTPGPDLAYNLKVLVMSSAGLTGASNVVTGVQVGRVLDTQQRRRRDLAENWVLASVDQGAS
jgi:hypothetical protein